MSLVDFVILELLWREGTTLLVKETRGYGDRTNVEEYYVVDENDEYTEVFVGFLSVPLYLRTKSLYGRVLLRPYQLCRNAH